jgi:hypothetical protein
MSRMRILVGVLVLGLASAAVAKPSPGQGRACDAKHHCDGKLQCVKRGDKSTCEQLCTSNAQCPENQRCVKDGSEMLCRPTTDIDL